MFRTGAGRPRPGLAAACLLVLPYSGGDSRDYYQQVWYREFLNLHGFAFLGAKDFYLHDYKVLQNALEQLGVHTRVQSAITMTAVCEPYIRRRALRHMEKGRVVIFAAGTGNPFFTTDTAAALRAIEINADMLLKATKVNGVFSDDPLRNPQATRYARLSFDKVLADRLNVMDATAIVMCRDNRLPLRVFNLNNPGDLTRIVRGEDVGTAVTVE